MNKMRGRLRYGCHDKLWAKKETTNVFFHLLLSDELLAYFPWVVVSKSLRTEMFHAGLVYYQ